MYYVTPKFIALHKCRIPGCQAQTSNEWCAKCVARGREERKAQHMVSAVEFLDAHDATVDEALDEALAYATLEDVIINGGSPKADDLIINGDPSASIPQGFLHARR